MKSFKFSQAVKDEIYLADYFKKTAKIIDTYHPDEIVTMQWFQRHENVTLAGINQAISLIKFMSPNYESLKVDYLPEGTLIQPMEVVLRVTGHYKDFGILEGMIDGILARNSSVATNSREIIDLISADRALNMADRADIYFTQEIDGYASYIGGFRNFVSEAALTYIDDQLVPHPSGTMPHALIQAFDGNLLEATKAFYEVFPNNKLVALVDYHNDCVSASLEVADYFKEKLYAVRLDTAANLTDKSLGNETGKHLNGVSEALVRKVREALDAHGHQHVKIIVSSGFNHDKIKAFEDNKVPVDIYGIGEALVKVKINFTGDAVLLDGKPQAKVGRKYLENPALQQLDWTIVQ